MTTQDTSSPLTAGEVRARRRRRILFAIFFFSLFLGLAAGFGMGLAEDGGLVLGCPWWFVDRRLFDLVLQMGR